MGVTYRGTYADVYASLDEREWRNATQVYEALEARYRAQRVYLGWLRWWIDYLFIATLPTIAFTYAGLEALVREGWAEIRTAEGTPHRYEWRRRHVPARRPVRADPPPAFIGS